MQDTITAQRLLIQSSQVKNNATSVDTAEARIGVVPTGADGKFATSLLDDRKGRGDLVGVVQYDVSSRRNPASLRPSNCQNTVMIWLSELKRKKKKKPIPWSVSFRLERFLRFLGCDAPREDFLQQLARIGGSLESHSSWSMDFAEVGPKFSTSMG